MKKFEYRARVNDETEVAKIEKWLNNYGLEGWELINYTADDVFYLFKRELQEEQKPAFIPTIFPAVKPVCPKCHGTGLIKVSECQPMGNGLFAGSVGSTPCDCGIVILSHNTPVSG